MITLVLSNSKTKEELAYVSAWDEADAPRTAAQYGAAHRVDVDWRIATDAEIESYMNAAKALMARVYNTANTAD